MGFGFVNSKYSKSEERYEDAAGDKSRGTESRFDCGGISLGN
jgi:hypothetical protein